MPQIAHFQVEKWKSSLPWEGGHPPPPRSVATLPRKDCAPPNVLAYYATDSLVNRLITTKTPKLPRDSHVLPHFEKFVLHSSYYIPDRLFMWMCDRSSKLKHWLALEVHLHRSLMRDLRTACHRFLRRVRRALIFFWTPRRKRVQGHC